MRPRCCRASSRGPMRPAVAAKLGAWLDNLNRRDKLPVELVTAPEFVETPTAKAIIATITYAQLAADYGLVVGEPGIGKTMALENFRDSRPNAWLATMSPATEGPVPMLKAIGFVLGLCSPAVGAIEMSQKIVTHLRGTRGVLILDEAQHLGQKALDELRAIIDASKIGLVLAGDTTLREKISAFSQLSSRIGKNAPIGGLSAADSTALARSLGIDGTDERRFLELISRQRGGLRCVVKTVRLGRTYAEGEGVPLGIDHLRSAWSNLNLGAAS